MQSFESRAGRRPLALASIGLAALAACGDEPTANRTPAATGLRPHASVGQVITVTSKAGTDAAGTLRWAVAQATGGEIIRFDPRLAGSTITLDSTLVIPTYLMIEGPADKGITISGGGTGRVIDIPSATLNQPATTFRNLSITGGKLTEFGGAGIRTAAALVLEHTTVWGNEAVSAPAILALGTVGGGRVRLVNSTVSGNISTLYGEAAVIAIDELKLVNSTVAYNSQVGISGFWTESMVLENSIVAHNGQWDCMLGENVTYYGTNISTTIACGNPSEVAIVVADPKLAPLAPNGGPSMTHALASGSPAFNAGMFACGVAVDQRYQPRDERCDAGAFESTDRTTVTITIERVASLNLTGNRAVLEGTVACSRAGDQFELQAVVQQKGSGKGATPVQATGVVSVDCSTSAQPWVALVETSSGTLTSGGAVAEVATSKAPSWVAPTTVARNIKLVVPQV